MNLMPTLVTLSDEDVARLVRQFIAQIVAMGGLPEPPESDLSNTEFLLVTGPSTTALTLSATYGTYTDRSGTIAVGGTSQQLVAANAGRLALWVHNPTTATEPIGVNMFNGAAVIGGAGTITIPAGGLLRWDVPTIMPTTAMQIVAATGTHQYVAGEV